MGELRLRVNLFFEGSLVFRTYQCVPLRVGSWIDNPSGPFFGMSCSWTFPLGLER